MTKADTKKALPIAVKAAQSAGRLMRTHRLSAKRINEATQHDIKLELDVQAQKRIERILQRGFPHIPILGEEGVSGDPEAAARWVVDPIDGTVNFTYGIPHACVSIALEVRHTTPRGTSKGKASSPFQVVLGVVYDPFCDELWTAIRGEPARLNGKVIRVNQTRNLNETMVAIGFAKNKATTDRMLLTFNSLIHRVRKLRVMGSAALALTYVASGRFDAYVEYGLRLWDIAAGGLIVECAGGQFWRKQLKGNHTWQLLASNKPISSKLKPLCRFPKT